MKNINKGLLLAVGAIVLCVIATIAFILTSESNNISGKNDVSAGSDNLVEVSKKTYDNSKVTGSEVISAINKYSSNDEVAVRIIHKNGNIDLYGVTGVAYCANEIDRINKYETVIEKVTSKDYDDTLDSNNSLYINPGSTFKSSIRYNNDDVVTLITFGQEGSNESLADYRHKQPLSSSDENYNGGAGSNNYARPDNSSTITKPGTGSSGGSDSTVEVPSTKKYTINYELNGGTLEKGISSYTENDEVVLPIPTKEDTDFLGWYTEDTFTNKVTKIEKGLTGDKTFYAKWGKLTAFAVYSEDGYTLRFYNRETVPKRYSMFDGSTVTKVYTDVDKEECTYSSPWKTYCAKIKEVTVVDEIKPISTAHWFDSFSNCTKFDLTNLNTSEVTRMCYMFYQAARYSASSEIIGIEKWDTSNVTDMYRMFWRSFQKVNSFKIDLSKWNTSNVANMAEMFYEAGNNATEWSIGDLGKWKVHSVTSMFQMFYRAGYNATSIDINMSNWNTSKVTDMRYMFYETGKYAEQFKIDITDWKTSNVTSMYYMFDNIGYAATTWSIGDLSNWDVSNVGSMYSMFHYAGYSATIWDIGNLSKWDTSNVKDMSSMFSYAGYKCSKGLLTGLEFWDISNVTTVSQMFYSCRATRTNTVNLVGWNTVNVSSYSNFSAFSKGVVVPNFE